LKLVGDNMKAVPRFASQVIVPQPIEDKTTRKVLTMERIRGEPIKKRMKRMMEEWAAKEGKSIKDFEAELKAKFEDPVELQKMLSQKPPSSAQFFVYRSMLRVSDLWANLNVFLRNQSKRGEEKQAYSWSTPPLDASRIATLLYDVHAHQLFVDGAFNADPHAGNVLICEDTNSNGSAMLGLVDFGNVQKIPNRQRRVSLATFYLAMAKDFSNRKETWNDAEIANRFADVGGQSINMDAKFLAANALLMYDMRYDEATLQRFGIQQDLSNIAEIYSEDSFKEFHSDLVNLQRLAQTLVGVASVIGAGQPSCARMWQRQCEELVEDCPSD
jgi:predicted unusual protein kinase regulating ubiquinone biosynthesis (AarF/ABC1/UbiB family)